MAITRPITKTIISTTAWGIPITDAVNANTADVAAMKPTAWMNATYQNGWSSTDTRPASYCRIGNIVFVRGVVSGGGISTAVFTLPAGFRPVWNTDFPVLSGSGFGAVSAQAAGGVVPYIGGTAGVCINFCFAIG